jgi:peptide/nickel transport system substrate-binding protein
MKNKTVRPVEAPRRRTEGLTCAALLALACTQLGGLPGSAAAQEVETGGTLIFARPDEPLTLDPFIPADNGSIWAIEQVCDTLVEADATGEGLEPGLAESWEISEDELVYTFALRQDAKFSNGERVTVEDVVFSYEKAARPDGTYAFLFEPVGSIEAADERHVRFTLEEPYAPLLSAVSIFAASVVHQESYEADPERFGIEPVCSGAFKVEEYSRGSHVTLVPNEHYWRKDDAGRQLPYLERVELRYVPESNARVLGLINGDFNVIGTVPFNQAAMVETLPDVTLEVQPIYRLDYVYLNHAKPPIDDRDIRLALNHAANREAILQTVYFGYGEIPNSYMPKINFHCASVQPIPFDLAKAKELVAASGYDGTPIELQIDTGNAPFRQIATILQQGWTAAGLNVELAEYDVGTAWGHTETGDYQAYMSYITSDLNDQDELAALQADHTGSSEAFFSRYRNDEVVELLRQARATSDAEKRQELYCQIQDAVYHDGYSVPINFVPALNAHHDRVKGWRNLTTGWWWLRDVWVDE